MAKVIVVVEYLYNLQSKRNILSTVLIKRNWCQALDMTPDYLIDTCNLVL